MRTFPFGPKARWPLGSVAASGLSPIGQAFATAPDNSALHTFNKANAVIAAASTGKLSAADLDDWSGGFDFHLGVYTND